MKRGALIAVGPVVLVSVFTIWAVHRSAPDPSPALCGTLAQIGATLLVAFAVETGGIVRSSSRRGRNPETLVGFLSCLGVCGLLGIAIAWALSEHSGDLLILEQIGFSWSIGSIALLGTLVACMPILMYEWTHAANTEYPDE